MARPKTHLTWKRIINGILRKKRLLLYSTKQWFRQNMQFEYVKANYEMFHIAPNHLEAQSHWIKIVRNAFAVKPRECQLRQRIVWWCDKSCVEDETSCTFACRLRFDKIFQTIQWLYASIKSHYRINLENVEIGKISGIQKIFFEKDFAIYFDETTDICGRYILNVVAIALNQSSPQSPILIDVIELDKTNAENIVGELTHKISSFWIKSRSNLSILNFFSQTCCILHQGKSRHNCEISPC